MSITVSFTRHGHVGEILFARPPHNFASPELLGAIAVELDRADADAEVRCSILVAEGKSFCAGADLAGDEAIVGARGWPRSASSTSRSSASSAAGSR